MVPDTNPSRPNEAITKPLSTDKRRLTLPGSFLPGADQALIENVTDSVCPNLAVSRSISDTTRQVCIPPAFLPDSGTVLIENVADEDYIRVWPDEESTSDTREYLRIHEDTTNEV